MLITILAARVKMSSDPHLILSFFYLDHTQRLSDFCLFSVSLLLAGSSTQRICLARREALFVPSPQEFLANVSFLTCK